MSKEYNRENISRARELRKNMTPQEKKLWYDFLRVHEMRFQRQKCVGGFVADFYCHKAKLVIEIDGAQHYTPEGRKADEFRTEILEEFGLTVIRFTNGQVNENFRGVCEYINKIVGEILG